MLSEKAQWEAIYKDLASRYGQMMTVREAAHETGCYWQDVHARYPEGWSGNGRGLRIKTISLAYQIAKK